MAGVMNINELVINGHIAPSFRSRVQNELMDVLKMNRGLSASLQSYIDNMGNESLLITLTGTIPMQFQGNTYHTPVNIFLPSEYPRKAPIVFVRPNSSMMIKRDHPNVTPNGECTHSYLTRWDSTFNSLIGTVTVLSDDFSKQSPLFTKDQDTYPQPGAQNPNPYPPKDPSPYPPSRAKTLPLPQIPPQYGGGPYPRTTSSPAMAPSSLGNGPYPYPSSQPAPAPRVDPRQQLSSMVRARLARDNEPALDLRRKLYSAEVDLTRERAHLQELEKSMPLLSAELDEMKTAYEAESASIANQLTEFNDTREKGGVSMLVNSVVPVSGLTEQALQEIAKRDALEDVMYVLMKRLNGDNIDIIIKQIRECAANQFMSVALIEKINTVATTGGHTRSPSGVSPMK